MMFSVILCVSLLACFAPPSRAGPPGDIGVARTPAPDVDGQRIAAGLGLRITQKGLDYAGDVALRMFEARLPEVRIPDQSGKSGSRFEYKISRIGLSTTGISSDISINTTGVTQVLTVSSVKMSASWWYKYDKGWFFYSDNGGFTAYFSNVRMTNTVTLGRSGTGEATMRSVRCSASIGGLDVKFTRGLSGWVQNLFPETEIKAALLKKLCAVLQQLINTEGNAVVAGTQWLRVAPDVEMDYRLVRAPVCASRRLDVYTKGEALWKREANQTSLRPGTLSLEQGTGRMMYISVSQYTLNTLGEVLYRHGKLQTSTRRTVSGVTASVAASSAPRVVITRESLQVQVAALTTIRVTEVNATFHIATNATLTLAASIVGNTLTFSVIRQSQSSQVIGTLIPGDVNSLVNNELLPPIIAALNISGLRGMRLPVVPEFRDPSLKLRNGYILVSTDILVP